MANESEPRMADVTTPLREIWPEAQELPCQLSVALQVPHFTVRDLLSLSVNSMVDTQRREGAHVPVMVHGVMVAWAEFDVIDDKLAVRMTEMV